MKRGPHHPVFVSVVGPLIVGLAMALAWPLSVAGADANELIKEGIRLRRQGDDAGALDRFQQAFKIDNSPRVVAQIGLAEQALGRWTLAHEHLTQALTVKTDPWIMKNRAAISEALSLVNDHVGKIEILGGSPQAEVRIDGTLRGTLPLPGPLTMATGMVTIDLSAPGLVPLQRTTMVRAQQTTRESFDPLAPIPNRERITPGVPGAIKSEPTRASPGPSVETVPPPADNPSEAPPTPPGTQPEGANDGPSPLRSGAKWVAWGLAGAGVALGIFGLVRQNSAADSFDRGCGVDPTGIIQPLPGSTTTAQGCRELHGDIDSNFRLEVIGIVGAAVFAGTGFVLWLTEPKPNQPPATAWACVPGVTVENGLWMGCSLRF